ncbi:MAG: hypothetical protein ACJATT_005323, partial [Myxococcota bacterium]
MRDVDVCPVQATRGDVVADVGADIVGCRQDGQVAVKTPDAVVIAYRHCPEVTVHLAGRGAPGGSRRVLGSKRIAVALAGLRLLTSGTPAAAVVAKNPRPRITSERIEIPQMTASQ